MSAKQNNKKTCPQYNGGVIKHVRGAELKVLLNTSQDVDHQKIKKNPWILPPAKPINKLMGCSGNHKQFCLTEMYLDLFE